MGLVYVYFLAAAVVWAAVYLVARLRWRGAFKEGGRVRLYPFLVVVRSEKLVKPLDRLASAAPLLWKTLSNIGVTVSAGLLAFAVYFLVNNLATYLFRPHEVGVQNIVIPLIIGVTIRLEHLPYMLLAFAIVLITHEGMHGLVARLENLRLKSTGVFLAFIFPGGFVEPDEEEFRRAAPRARARVAAAGSFANVVVGMLVLLLMLGLFLPTPRGVVVLETEGGGGPQMNEIILRVNGVPATPSALFQNLTVEKTLIIETSRRNYTYQLTQPLNAPMAWLLRSVGIIRVDYYRPMVVGLGDPEAEYGLYRALWWIQLIAFGVAIFNMLPIQFLDGHLLLFSLLQPRIKSEKKLKALEAAVAAAAITLLASNIAFTYKTFGFFQL